MGKAYSTYDREEECIYDFDKKVRRYHLEDQEVGETITLKWILGRQDGSIWTGIIWLRIGTNGGALVNTVTNLRLP
jgi:hypothetical protein